MNEKHRDDSELVDNIDRLMEIMRPRYVNSVSMDGRYPCWIVWLPSTGKMETKDLASAFRRCWTEIMEGTDHEGL